MGESDEAAVLREVREEAVILEMIMKPLEIFDLPYQQIAMFLTRFVEKTSSEESRRIQSRSFELA